MVQIDKVLFVFISLMMNQISRGADFPYKLLLSVYYESQCPDSKSFILQQLAPTMQLLHGYLRLQLIPFGKSKSIDFGYGGFDCQHGPSECLGNIVQDCALHFMRHLTDLERIAYVACEMETEAGSKGSMECVQKVNLSTEAVQHCVSFDKGIILQLDSEYQTETVEPKFIPTVTINKIFNQQIQDFAQIDLLGTLCSILKETPPCAQYYNSMAWNNIMYDPPRELPESYQNVG